MGHVRHHAIVVTSWDDTKLQAAHAHAKSLGMAVTDIVEAPVNGYATFAVTPDGSKEGWSASDVGDNQRAEFRSYLNGLGWRLEWFEAMYGNDDGYAEIEAQTWDNATDDEADTPTRGPSDA